MYPFPHVYINDLFPSPFYKEIRKNLPPRETSSWETLHSLGRVNETYPRGRNVLLLDQQHIEGLGEPYRDFWRQTAVWLLGPRFGYFLLRKFQPLLEQRFSDYGSRNYYSEAQLVTDETNYFLEPHTDAPKKVLTFLIYLPEDDSMSNLGTSIYTPKEKNFLCPGVKHWDRECFDQVCTMPYVPNTLFGFFKTDQSFHGVEKIENGNIKRDLLLLDIYTKI
jgi:hypothetical protein